MLLVSAVFFGIISYMHLAFASFVYHTTFQMSLFFSWFPILGQFNFFLWIIPTYCKTVCFLSCTRAPQPDLKQFQMVRIARISLRQITPDVILRNLVKFLTTRLVSRLPLSDIEKSWPRKRSLSITRKVLRLLLLLLCKQFSLCFSLVMRAIGWANVADSDLIFRGISFRYRWEPARQDNISRVYLHLSTKLSKKRPKW